MDVHLTDQMSHLPEFINHHIMSFLDSPKDLVRMSVLSKYWFQITASFPILNFDIRKFEGFNSFYGSYKNGNNCIDKFYKYVEYTTSRFCRHQINVPTAHTFKLVTSLWDATQVDIVDKCFELIRIKGGVQVLVIIIRGPMDRDYRLSSKLLVSSASSLKFLKIHGCKLPLSFLVDNVIEFKSLKRLKLKLVPNMDENMLKRLATSCPLLEELVKYCHGLKSLCVYGLENLQRVKFSFVRPVERIDIEALNLCFLRLGSAFGRPSCFNVASCKKLTTLCYLGDPSPTWEGWEGLADFSSDFPYLKTLFLHLPSICDSLKLSSHSLTTFVLHSSDRVRIGTT